MPSAKGGYARPPGMREVKIKSA